MEVGNLVEIIFSYADDRVGKLAVITGEKPKEGKFQSWAEVYIKELDSGKEYSIETDCIKVLAPYADKMSRLLWL